MPRRPAVWVLVRLGDSRPIALVAAARSSQPSYDFDRYYEIATHAGRRISTSHRISAGNGPDAPRAAAQPAAASRSASAWCFSTSPPTRSPSPRCCGAGVPAAACYALIVIRSSICFSARGSLSTALVAVAVAAWQRERRIARALAPAGAALKLWPLAFLRCCSHPTHAGGWHRSPRRLPLDSRCSSAGCGWRLVRFYEVLTFRGAHGWEIESTVGSIWMLVSRETMRVESGAWRVGTTTGGISIAVVAVAALPCVWMLWQGARTDRAGAGWVGGVAALPALSAILSPQYAAWLAPGCAIAWAQRDRSLAILGALAIFATNVIWKSFNPLVHGAAGPLTLLVARNILLVVIAGVAARRLARAPVRRSA